MFSKEWSEVPIEFSHPSIGEIRSIEAGEMTIELARARAGTDLSQALKGLADDLCPSPHWGYALSGSFLVRSPTDTWRVKAGEAYYFTPGHSLLIEEDCMTIDISPTAIRKRRMAHLLERLRDR